MRLIEETFRSNKSQYESLDNNFKEMRKLFEDAVKDTHERGMESQATALHVK